jgi:NAD+ diphosphatase
MQPLTYTLHPLDRATLLRGDAARVRALLTGGAARIVPVWNQKNFVDETPRLRTLAHGEINIEAATLVFLGVADDDTPWFVAGLPESEEPPAFSAPGAFKDLNTVVGLLPGDDAAILAYARAMVIWHYNHRHCGRCGAPAAMTESGHSRTCTNTACNHRTFPRTDPVVITLITKDDKCLLGRQAVWPPGMYSCIAGFVEPGETLENAVRREAGEETGVKIGEVRYVASQPWPFPASIMLGFRAQALTTDVQRNDNELEDCRWFSKSEIRTFGERNAEGTGFKLPNRYAIARYLIEGWLAE